MFSIVSSFSDCSMNVHHKCQTKVANLCGINQKLLAEALTQVSSVYINVCTGPSYEALNINITALKYWNKVCVYLCCHRNPPSDLKATRRATRRMLLFTRILTKVQELMLMVRLLDLNGGNSNNKNDDFSLSEKLCCRWGSLWSSMGGFESSPPLSNHPPNTCHCWAFHFP